MFAEPARCEVHRTVLTETGTCLLCARTQDKKRSILPWTVALVVGALVTTAAVFRIYLSVSDHHPAQAATPDPAKTTVAVAEGAPATNTAAPAATIPGTDHASLVAEAERDVVIDFYGAAWCPACRRAKSWLDANGQPYAYHDVDDSSNKRGLYALNPAHTIPTIKIDDEVFIAPSGATMRNAIRRSAEARVAKRGR